MRTVIIGAGAAGLATAGLLAAEGHDVTVLERGESVGGRAGMLERDGFRFDTGPSWYLMPDVYEHFFELLGTSVAEQFEVQALDPGYVVFSEPARGGPAERFTVPQGRSAVRAAFESLEPGSGERLDEYLDSAWKANHLSRSHFLYNPFTSSRWITHREVLSATGAMMRLLGTSLEKYVAKRFTHPVIRQILGYPAVFLGTRPQDAPAMYHLMSALDLDEGVGYPLGGFNAIMERLAAVASERGATIITGADVSRIATSREGKRPAVTGVEWRDKAGAVHVIDADAVVSAADLHHTETALIAKDEATYDERWWSRRTSGPGAVLVMLGVRGELPQLEHHNLLFTRDWGRNFSAIFDAPTHVPDPASMYVCKPSATDPSVAPAGHENLFILVPVPADTAIGSGGADGAGDHAVEKAADAAIDQLAAWAGIPDLRDRIVLRHSVGPADFANNYNSWSGGMLGPAHILRQSAMFRARNASRRVDGLYYAGATTSPGVGVPMCLISAEIVVKLMRGDSSPGPLPVRKSTEARA
jgi:phytoene desaturase